MKIRIYCTLILMLIIIAASSYSVANAFSYFHYIIFFAVSGFLIILFSNFISIFKYWEKYKLKAIIPFIIAFVCLIVFALFCKFMVADKSTQELINYKNVIRLINEDKITVSNKLKGIEVPDKYKGSTYKVLAKRDNKGILTVEFLVGKGFPLKHSGLLYRSNGTIEDDSFFQKRWFRIKRINDQWFRISD